MRIVYMGHPYGGKPENLARARRWLAWLWRTRTDPHTHFVAPWIDCCENVSESQENRDAGLLFDCQMVRQCSEMWLVGGRISDGMRKEMAHARHVVDLTNMGDEPPPDVSVFMVRLPTIFEPQQVVTEPAPPVGTPSDWQSV